MDLNDLFEVPEIDNRDQIMKKLRNARETDSVLQIKMILLTCLNFLPIEPELQNKMIKMLDFMYKNHYISHAFRPADISKLVPLILRLYSKHKYANLRELTPGLDCRLYPFLALEKTLINSLEEIDFSVQIEPHIIDKNNISEQIYSFIMIILKTDSNSINKIIRKAPKPILDDLINNNKPHNNLCICLILEKVPNFESPDFF